MKGQSSRWRFSDIDRALLPYKLFYLAQFSGLACMTPFLPVFYRLRGLTESQIGFLGFLKPFVAVPTVPLWTALADRLGLKKTILLVTVLGSTFLRFLYMYPPSFATLIPLVVLASALGGAPLVLADAFTMDVLEDKTDYGKQRLWGAVGWGLAAPVCGAIVTATKIESAFYLHALFLIIASIVATQFRFKGPEDEPQLPSHANKTSMRTESHRDLEQQVEMHAREGNQSETKDRLLPGKFNGETGNPVVDKVEGPESDVRKSNSSDRVSQAHLHSLKIGFDQEERDGLFSSAPDECSQPSDRTHPRTPHSKSSPLRTEAKPPSTVTSFFSHFLTLFSDPSVCCFFGIMTLMGVAMGTIEGFLPLFLNELGGSPTLIGLSLTVTCVAEVPMMWFSGRLIKRLGVLGVLYLALACYLARFAYYSLLTEPWAVLPIELLHGITFGCGWTAGTVHSGRIAPPGLGATMQALFSAAYFGIGAGFGMLLGGVVYERYGAVVLFRGAGVLLAGGALLFGLSQRWFPMVDHGKDEEGHMLVPLGETEP